MDVLIVTGDRDTFQLVTDDVLVLNPGREGSGSTEARQLVEKILDVLRRGERFLVTSHCRPDGDAVGSMTAMGLLLGQMGKEPTLHALADWTTRNGCDTRERVLMSEARAGTRRGCDVRGARWWSYLDGATTSDSSR